MASRSRIAVVEDNADNRLLVRAILQANYDLLEYESGAEALAAIPAAKPDLILLDISLPKMDGGQVLQKLRQDESLSAVPVIALTAHAMVGDREKYMQLGFDDYISKPITDVEAFRGTIERHLRRPQKPGS
ncbi:MAG: response regulator [Candidatus Latescibacterota bacterium]|nr:MAG: response regulator [Candidatus Latescibacterota bacterium]